MTFYPTVFSDSFNRADSTDLGPDWAVTVGSFEVRTNALTGAGASARVLLTGRSAVNLSGSLVVSALPGAAVGAQAGFIWQSDPTLASVGIFLRFLWADTSNPGNAGNVWQIIAPGGVNLTLHEVVAIPLTIAASIVGTTVSLGTPGVPKIVTTLSPTGFTSIGLTEATPVIRTLFIDDVTVTFLDEQPPTQPTTFPAGGGGAFSLARSPYSTYKNIRQATNVYNNLVLTP